MEFVYALRSRCDTMVKIGYTTAPSKRLMQFGIDAKILAVATGDRLTETELHWRFRAEGLGGEFFNATPDILAFCAATRSAGTVPGAWYLPDGWHDHERGCWTMPLASLLTGCDRAAIGAKSGVGRPILLRSVSVGIAAKHVPAMLHALRDWHPGLTLLDLYHGCLPAAARQATAA